MAADPHRERRSVRPKNGDVKVCPHCGRGAEFNERYRFAGEVTPAWVCDRPTCPPQPVRRPAGTARRRRKPPAS